MTDGVLLIDKPYGITSFDVVHRVRRIYRDGRVGHAGTLDPLATGLLPVLLGKATPLLRFLPAEPKAYRVVARFGVGTASGDAETAPVAICDPGASPPPQWEQAVQSLVGEVRLAVPRYSAVKVDGQPLYRHSREGRTVTLPERVMQVHTLKADPSGWPWVTLDMETAGGTYVRAVVESLGQRCGMPAHVASLRRLRVGAWTIEDASPLAECLAGRVGERSFVPLARALALPVLALDPVNSCHVAHGRMPQRVHSSNGVHLQAGEPFLFVDLDGDALAVAASDDGWQDDTQPPRCHFERVLTRPS